MTIERIKQVFSSSASHRFTILHGEGLEDIFVNQKLQELTFEEAIYEELKRQRFERVVFYSPHRSIFFFDEKSADLSRLSGVSPKAKSSPAELSMGPLQEVKVFRGQAVQVEGPRRGIGDVHALRMLDKILRETSAGQAAVVFLQAETSLRFFEDLRTLAGLVGDWSRLPSTNPNRVYFAFSVDDFAGLSSIANEIAIPELRSAILRKTTQPTQAFHIKKIGTPELDEIQRITALVQKRTGLTIVEVEFDHICHRMVNEGRQARFWMRKLVEIQRLDWETVRQLGWFTAIKDSLTSVWERLDNLVGLEAVKLRIREIAAWLKIARQRGDFESENADFPNLHMIFTGNPGTGKTTAARLFGELFFELGLLKRGHLVEVRASDLIAEHVGGTAIKTNGVVDRALDGVLFIDEAYALVEDERGGFGREAVDTLLTRLEDDRRRLVVIAAGYPEKMEHFRQANPGLARRFPAENIIFFADFSANELWTILRQFLEAKSIPLSPEFEPVLRDVVIELHRRKDAAFGNAGEMRNLAEALDQKRAFRIANSAGEAHPELLVEDLPATYQYLLAKPNLTSSQVFLQDLDRLTGLAQVKQRLSELAQRVEFEYTRYMLTGGKSRRPALQHLLFTGKPGTGKTSVARLVGQFYKNLGLLRKGHCIEVSRADLVAGYVGQTAMKTMEKIRSALDGVLFIDEAYALDRGADNDFGAEAIDVLVKAMEDYRDRLLVIAAGYPREMKNFVRRNPGLQSRFGPPLVFEDFTADELAQIFSQALIDEGYELSDEILVKAREYLLEEKNQENERFGNARSALRLADLVKTRLAQRVLPQAAGLDQSAIISLMNIVQLEDVPGKAQAE